MRSKAPPPGFRQKRPALTLEFDQCRWRADAGRFMERLAVEAVQGAELCVADAHCVLLYGLENPLYTGRDRRLCAAAPTDGCSDHPRHQNGAGAEARCPRPLQNRPLGSRKVTQRARYWPATILDPFKELVPEIVSAIVALDHGVLPIQGPPGTGKTYVSSCAILDLVMRGKRVAVASNSHKAVDNLLCAVIDRATEQGGKVSVAKKGGDELEGIYSDRIYQTERNDDARLAGSFQTLCTRAGRPATKVPHDRRSLETPLAIYLELTS